MTREGFRKLIILQWLLTFAYFIVYFATLDYLPPQLLAYRSELQNAEPTTKDWFVVTTAFLLFLCCIITSIGLYKFKAWAKKLLLLILAVNLIIAPFSGVCIQSEWASTVAYLICLVEGGILFLVFLSPVSQMFETDGDYV
ncbi:MAG TPA: hypothetical protein VK400_17130 [Pyrinomonadaceae bacterium]|nr:hypothetical protein [Pyrinomonadaceae bacterium]